MLHIEKCIEELNNWLRTRPYYKKIDVRWRKNGVFESKTNIINRKGKMSKKEEDEYGEIHIWLGTIFDAIGKPDYNKEYMLFEYITPILKRYEIDSLSVGYNIYKLKGGEYKMINKINKNM